LITDELRQKIHLWLSAPDPSSNQNDARKKRQPTTGAWFIDGKKFKQWKHNVNSFIWLHGIRKFTMTRSYRNDVDKLPQLALANRSYGKYYMLRSLTECY
jgi:hypothetical protein